MAIKYSVIRNEKQYYEYCGIIQLAFVQGREDDEVKLIWLLIDRWQEEHHALKEVDPVTILASLMEVHKLNPVDLAKLLRVNPGLISDVLHYKKGFTKEMILKLAAHFSIHPDAFNRFYELINHPQNESMKKIFACMGNIPKDLSD